MEKDSLLQDLGIELKKARLAAKMTQEHVAHRAGISRPRYQMIESGDAAARVTTLVNIARALQLELMLVPQTMVPGINAMLHQTNQDDRPAFVADSEDN